MAGTLTISTLSDGTNSTSSTNCIQGSAKAWVNFNGSTTTPTIRASYNVGSVTKTAADNYTVNFSAAMTDANYCVSGSHSEENLYAGAFVPNSYTTSSVVIRTFSYNEAGGTAPAYVNVVVHR